MISISIASDKANITVMCKNESDLQVDAAALVATYQNLMNGVSK
jgi:hypothetical protein